MDGLVVIALTKDKLVEAYQGLTGMAEIFPKMLKKINCDGLGEKDAKDCREHLNIAASACLTLINVIDGAEVSALSTDARMDGREGENE